MLGKNLSLRWRMALVIVFGPLIPMLLIFFFVGSNYRNAYREAYLNQADVVAYQVQQILGAISPYIDSIYDAPNISKYLEGISELGKESTGPIADASETRLFSFISLVQDDGWVIYHSNQGVLGDYAPGLAHLSKESSRVVRIVEPYGPVYLVFREVAAPGESVDQAQKLYVVVAMSVSVVDPPLLVFTPILAGMMIVVLLLVAMRLFMDRMVFKPLINLTEGAARIGAGDLDYVIGMDREDEVGQLAHAFNDMAHQLRVMVSGLESQVADRTAALQRQANFLKASNLVSRDAVQIRDVQRLLDSTMRTIPGYFGFYHAGIFLLDENGTWAVLRAASSEGGQRMMTRGYRLPVNQQGIVGMVASTGKPRIAFNAGEDAAWFNNPDLPRTRSEMALPLKTAEKVIGVLDVQSEESGAFSDEDVAILQGMADQLTVALENARLLEGMQAALKELESLHQDYSRSGWARVKARLQTRAYEYDQVEVHPVPPLPVSSDLLDGTLRYKLGRDGATPVLMAPLPVRDQVIGVLALADSQRSWSQDEISLVESVSEQVGLAIENARLFEDAQRTARHQALLNLVLQTAAASINADQALKEMAVILAQGLDMAVGFFTYPNPQLPRVHAHAFVTPEGISFEVQEEQVEIQQELHLFFRGLSQPEHGRFFSAPELFHTEAEVGTESLDQYDLNRSLYVPLATAGTVNGFMVLVQRGGWLLDPETRELVQNLGRQIGIVLENMGLAEDTRRRSAELQALYEISLRLNQSMEPEELLGVVVEQAQDLFDAAAGGVLLLEPGGNTLVFSTTRGHFKILEGSRVSLDEGLAGAAFQTRQPQRVENYHLWEGRSRVFQNMAVEAMMAIPLMGLAGPLGVLDLGRSADRPAFDDRDLRLAELFVAQAASAYENARLYQETTRRAEELQRLYDAGLDLISQLDVQEVIDRGADWARRLFRAPIGILYLWDEKQNTYQIGRGMDSPGWLERDVFPEVQASELAKSVQLSGESVLISDGRRESGIPTRLLSQGLVSQMGVPLRLGTKLMGGLLVSGDHPEQFTHHDLQLLEFLGTQIAGAVQNATQFGQTQSALAIVEKQALYQTSVAQATALLSERGTQALDLVLELLGAAVQADQVYYFWVHTVGNSFVWRLENRWSRGDFEDDLIVDVPESLNELRVSDFEYWRTQMVERGIWTGEAAELPEAERVVMEGLEARSMVLLAVPGDEPVPGLMAFVDRFRNRVWREEENNALLTAANALASTLARERLFDQVQEALAETEALYRGGAELNMVRSYDEVLLVLRRHTALGSGAYNMSVQVFDRPWTNRQSPTWAQVLARWTEVPNAPYRQRYALAEMPIASERIMSVDEPSLIADIMTDSRMDEGSRSILSMLGAKSAVFIPLIVGGERIGFINALYHESFDFTETEIRRIVSLGKQAAMVIQNLHQLETIQARAQRERLIREITSKIQAAPDVQSVLQTTLKELGRAMGTPRNQIQMRHPGGTSAMSGGESGPEKDAAEGQPNHDDAGDPSSRG